MKLACKDINPTTTCNFEVEGATKTEAAEKMLVHAREAHAEDIADKTDEVVIQEFEGKVRE